MPWNPDYYQNINWKTGPAAERARHNLKLKKNKKRNKPQAPSRKQQALKKTQFNGIG
tara:strand:- start:1464 stop:1634 length:171 start_codon:yes stop_codon:yes gene_type:complete